MEISQLGLNIKKSREEKGWSLNKLKQESGVGYATLHDIESGKSKNLNTNSIEKIATALNKAIDELLGFEIVVLVDDLEETFIKLLESDEVKIDGKIMSPEEKSEIVDFMELGIEKIRRNREKCNK